MKRIFYIASHFPPTGGAGVQRTLKFIKYLPSFGILPTVLTGIAPAPQRWTPRDETLLEEVPAEVPIIRALTADTRTKKPSARRQRYQAMLEAGEQALSIQSHELILVSMSPFEDARLAASLAERTNLPWIADLRDPWALDEFQVYRTRLHRAIEHWKMRKALKSAALIIMNTPESAHQLRRSFPEITSAVISITNGYDADDFAKPAPKTEPDKFTIVHSGYFHTHAGLQQRQRGWEYRLFGRIERDVKLLARSHYFLVKSLELWAKSCPEIFNYVRVRCLGVMTPSDREVVERSQAATLFEFADYLPHEQCLRAVRQADLLFLPLHEMPKGRRATIVPGKTYEYMASGIPILAAVPEGDARDFVTQAGTGRVCDPDDVDGMLRILNQQFNDWLLGKTSSAWNQTYVESFERRRLTKQLALVMKPLCNSVPDPTELVAVTT